MKILKTKYLAAAELLRFSSGFGWDSATKRFTAPDEVWTEYIKAQLHTIELVDGRFCPQLHDVTAGPYSGAAGQEEDKKRRSVLLVSQPVAHQISGGVERAAVRSRKTIKNDD
ncbi:Myb/SANT-like domain protein [Raphanus sativus]|nr:Myb/SANT-like domain protein [Raphanus sativus]